MPRSIRTTTAALLATTGVLATASLVAAAPANAASHRKTLFFHATTKKIVKGATTVRPGLVQIHNSGNGPLLLLSQKHGGLATLVADLAHPAGNKVLADFAIRGVVLPHRSLYLRLHHGTMFVLDAERMHYPAESIHAVSIAGKTWNAALPKSRAITINGHNELKVPANASRKTFFHVVNNSSRLQAISLMRLSAGTSVTDIKAAVANPSDATFEKLDPTDFTEVGELSPHQTLWIQVQSPKGYSLAWAESFTRKHVSIFHKGCFGAIHFS